MIRYKYTKYKNNDKIMVQIHLHFGLILWENAFQNDGNHQNDLNDSCFTSMKSMIKLAIKLINQNKQLN